MTSANFDGALRRMLAHEGGYTNDPADRGGPTNFGITIADYRKYVKPDATAADVRAMRMDDAKKIYLERYWRALRCDDLPSGIDYAVFDYGVNSGTSRSGKVLRRLSGISASSGKIDDAAIAAAAAGDCKKLIIAICDERLAFLQSLKTWPVFGAGWARRVAEVRAAALSMAGATPIAADVKKVSNAAVTSGAAGAVVVAGAAAHQTVGMNAALIAGVALIVAACVGWLIWHRLRNLGVN